VGKIGGFCPSWTCGTNEFKVYDLGLRLDDIHDLIERFPALGGIDALGKHALIPLGPILPPLID